MSEEVKNTQQTNKPTAVETFEDSKVTEKEEESFTPDRSRRPRRKRPPQNLKCPLCEAGVKDISYKDVYQLKKFTSVKGKIISTEKSGVCNKHQRKLKSAIKRARFMSLLPYSLSE